MACTFALAMAAVAPPAVTLLAAAMLYFLTLSITALALAASLTAALSSFVLYLHPHHSDQLTEACDRLVRQTQKAVGHRSLQMQKTWADRHLVHQMQLRRAFNPDRHQKQRACIHHQTGL